MDLSEVHQYLTDVLNKAQNLQLNLSENESDYTLQYIANAIGRTSAATEQLSDMIMDLTRVELLVIEEAARLRQVYELKEAATRDSDAYMNYEYSRRSGWLRLQVKDEKQRADEWEATAKAFVTVKKQVVARSATIKRIESAVRLQAKVYDMVAGGHNPVHKPGFKNPTVLVPEPSVPPSSSVPVSVAEEPQSFHGEINLS